MTRPRALTDGEVILEAIHPNAGLDAWYRAQLQKHIRRMAKSMLLHLRAAYERGDILIGQDSADGTVTLRNALERWAPKWVSNFDAIAERVSRIFANRSAADLDRRMMHALARSGFTVKFKPTKAMKQAYRAVIAEQVNLIRSIPEQFLKDVRSSVWQSVMKGGDQAGLTQAIQDKYDVAHRRAVLIARDQNAKARAVFERTRRAELGIKEAIWVHSGGGREPRPEHAKWGREKARYEVKQGMWSEVDGEYVWPGTPINCRCVSRAIVPALT